MSALLKDIYQRKDLLVLLVARNLKIRYKNSALGFFWSLLGPLFLIAIYSIFLGILKVPIPLEVLVVGIIVWQYLAMCLGDSLSSITGNANLVTKASFPRIILPMAMTKANLVNFLLSLVVVVGYLMISGVEFGAVYWLPVIILSQFALCLGVALIFSCANVFFRDTEHIMSILMLAWFFMSPIIYPISKFQEQGFPEWMRYLFFANPMTGIVTSYRMALLSDPNPGTKLLSISFLVAWALLFIGIAIFQKFQSRFGDEL